VKISNIKFLKISKPINPNKVEEFAKATLNDEKKSLYIVISQE